MNLQLALPLPDLTLWRFVQPPLCVSLWALPISFPPCFMNTHHLLMREVDTVVPNSRIHHLTPVLGFNFSTGFYPEVHQPLCYIVPKSSDMVKEEYNPRI